MKDLELVWSSVARTRGGEAVSPDLKPLVFRVHSDVAASAPNGKEKSLLPSISRFPKAIAIWLCREWLSFYMGRLRRSET